MRKEGWGSLKGGGGGREEVGARERGSGHSAKVIERNKIRRWEEEIPVWGE